MILELLNKSVFSTFEPIKDKDNPDKIGFYGFHLLEYDPTGGLSDALIYGASVYKRHGHVMMEYDGGDPPSARAGLALDLHCGAVASVKKSAASATESQAYFIDDAGKLAVSSLAWFKATRAPAVVAIAPAMFAYDALDLYQAVTGGHISGATPAFTQRH